VGEEVWAGPAVWGGRDRRLRRGGRGGRGKFLKKTGDTISDETFVGTGLFGNFRNFFVEFLKKTFLFIEKKMNSILRLQKFITYSYELRFRRTLCPRTRIDEHYNFREGSFLKNETTKKSNREPIALRHVSKMTPKDSDFILIFF
jgi:hypothetical protein